MLYKTGGTRYTYAQRTKVLFAFITPHNMCKLTLTRSKLRPDSSIARQSTYRAGEDRCADKHTANSTNARATTFDYAQNAQSVKISAPCRKHIRLALCRKSQPICAILAAVQPIQPHDPPQRLGTTTIPIETIRPANTPNAAHDDSRLSQPLQNDRACFTSNISILNARKPCFCAICLVYGCF